MRKIFTTLKSVVAATVIAAMALATSCSYDDSAITERVDRVEKDLAALTERVAALEKKLGDEVEALKSLIDGKTVVTEVTTDAEGNTVIKLSDGKEITVLAGCDCEPATPCTCDPLEYRVVDGVLELSADGENWVPVQVAPECVVAEVTVNDDNTVTIKLANGEEFTVVKAELIEFNSTRAQSYIKAGETKEISFTVNDAVADINIMNQPLGWKATVEAAAVEEGDEPEAGVLAAGGTEFVLKVTAPSSEFVATGFAEKEGFVSVHFNTAAGACKVAKLQVNLAEITLDVDKAGNVTITNTLVDTYLYSDPWDPWGNSELISEFNNYYLAVMPLDYYTEDLESIYNASWGEFTVPSAGGWISNIYMNLNDRNPMTVYEEGVTESWTVVATVEEIIDYLDWYGNLTYEGESFMVLVVPTDIENSGKLLLDQALAAPFKQLNVNVVENEAERKFNNAYFNVTLRGGLAYNLFPVAVAEIEEYIAKEYYASVEEYFEQAMQQYVAQPQWSSFGFKVSTDVVESNIALMDLLGYTLDYAPYFAIEPNTEYVMAIFTEQEGKTEYTSEDLKYVYFATADIVAAATPAEYTIEYNENRTYTNIGVDITVPEDTAVAYTRWYEEQQLELDALKDDLIAHGYDRTDFEMGYTYSTSTAADKAAAVRYLGLLIVNANGEYTLVQKELTSKDVVYNAATLAIDKVEFPGDGTAKVYFSGIDGLEIDYIHFYSSDVANTSSYYKNLTEEELADIAYSDNRLYRTANDNSNPVVIPNDVAYDTFEIGKTYKFALGVAFTDGTVSHCAYLEAENALPEGAGLVFATAAYTGDVYGSKQITFTAEDGTVVTYGFTGLLGNYFEEKFYNYEYASDFSKDYRGQVSMNGSNWPGFDMGWAIPTMDVKIVDGVYNITLKCTHDTQVAEGTYVGDIEGFDYPAAGPTEDTAVAVLNEDVTFSGEHPYDVTFTFTTGEEVTLRFNTGGKNYIPVGEWQSDNWQEANYISDVKLKGGNPGLSKCVVSYADDKYTVELAMYDWDNSKSVEVTYVGAIEGLVAPEATEPSPEDPEDPEDPEVAATELTITSHFTIYGGSAGAGEHELGFYYDEANGKFVDIDFLASPIVAGTYTLTDGLSGMYCKSHGGDITDITVIVTDNGDGTLTFDATFKAGDGNWYHFTYTAQIYA